MAKLKNRTVAEQRVREYIIDSMQKSIETYGMTLADTVKMQEQAAEQINPRIDWDYLYEYRKCRTDLDRLHIAVGVRVEGMSIDALSNINQSLKLYKK